jgi:hypothetical protein
VQTLHCKGYYCFANSNVIVQSSVIEIDYLRLQLWLDLDFIVTTNIQRAEILSIITALIKKNVLKSSILPDQKIVYILKHESKSLSKHHRNSKVTKFE